MPAQVPAGYTRGSILLLNPAPAAQSIAEQLQRFWGEAGGYGARILVLTIGAGSERADAYVALLREWETTTVQVAALPTRHAAQQLAAAEIERATGILLLGDDPLRMAAILGGTAAAQGLRHANARSKALAGVGPSATFLCQHMLLIDRTAGEVSQAVYFAPGLGAINRVMLLVEENTERALDCLLRGVSFNPFLVGLALPKGLGAVIYPNSTIEVYGQGRAQLVDAADVSDEKLFNPALTTLATAPGVNIHQLSAGDTFQIETRTVQRLVRTDMPRSGAPMPEPR